jgi:hypothetical protein
MQHPISILDSRLWRAANKFRLQAQTTINIVAIGIFLAFFSLYFSFSLLLAQTGSFSNYSIFFEIDTPRVIGDMTIFDANHYRTKVHPLFVLLINPIGTLLTHILKSQLVTAIFLNSFFGALGVVLAFFYVKLMTESVYSASLLACFFGVTTSQFFLSVNPETASLSICSLMVTYILFLSAVKYKRDNFLLWVFAGILTLAITTTNFVQTFICFTIFSFMRSNLKKRPLYTFVRVMVFLVCVVTCVALFSKIQKIIYPSSSLFYAVDSYAEDFLYTSLLIFRSPLVVISQLLKHSFLVNIIAPFPDFFSIGLDQPAITFSHSLNYTLMGWLAVVLWFIVLVMSAVHAIRQKQEVPLIVGFAFAVCLLFNFAFHSIYGLGVSGEFEYFLYTGNFSFLAFSSLAYTPLRSKAVYHIVLGILIILAGINNATVLIKIIDVYSNAGATIY